MKVCTFAGHSMFVECKLSFEKLKNTIESLISQGVNEFLIGSHGEFDKMALLACLDLKEKHSHIKIYKVFSNISTMLKEKNVNNNIEKIDINEVANIEEIEYQLTEMMERRTYGGV